MLVLLQIATSEARVYHPIQALLFQASKKATKGSVGVAN
jgi:hypothetical protein